ncbi:hypothetical protein AAFN60_05345 [Roseibacillus persicicus]|uniref:hypothetical protein n=1 Tax=Roseibacillus persicicus TaxID=454148 RepID=UPI00398ADCAB
MKTTAPLFFIASATVVFGHHGQDFLVTLDTATPHPWQLFSTSGFDYSKQGSEEELSLLQGFTLGLPSGFTAGASYRIGDEGSGQWASESITPTLQWNGAKLEWGEHSSLSLGFALGWEIPTSGTSSNHSHGGDLALQDCSSLIGIPALYQACLLANEERLNHSHDEDGHSHDGIHRHGESHGFLRLIAELELGERDKIASNLIAVFPEDGDPAFGYALAYRHRFNELFSAGLEATGDFDSNGEHLLYLTTTFYPNDSFSITLGTATGLTPDSADLSVQSLLTWRF